MRGQVAGHADEVRHVKIVPAGVHHRHRRAAGSCSADLRGIGQSRLFGDRQGVHVGPQHQHFARPVLQHAHDAVSANAGRHRRTDSPQLVGHPGGGLLFLQRQLGVLVQVLIQLDELRQILDHPRWRGWRFVCRRVSRGDETCRDDRSGRQNAEHFSLPRRPKDFSESRLARIAVVHYLLHIHFLTLSLSLPGSSSMPARLLYCSVEQGARSVEQEAFISTLHAPCSTPFSVPAGSPAGRASGG